VQVIPILDSTAAIAPDSEGLRSTGPNTSQGSKGEQFGSILSAQERGSVTTDVADGLFFDGLESLLSSGNELPSGGKSLPASPLSPELEFTAEHAIASRGLSIGSNPAPEPVLAPLVDSITRVFVDGSDGEISTATPGVLVPVQVLELEAAAAANPGEGELPAQPLLLPDALLKLINTTNATGGDRPERVQPSTVSVTQVIAPTGDVFAEGAGPDQKSILADAEFSVVTRSPDSAVEVTDVLKGVDSLALKASPGNALSAAQTAAVGQLNMAESVNTPSGPLKSGVTAPLHAPVGGPEWNGEFASRIGLMVKNGMPEASLQLNPAELGRLDIKISTDGDQAKVVFTVQNLAAREAIEQAMPRLRDMLEQSGLQLAHSEVADHSQSRQQRDDMMNTFSGSRGAESEELSPEVLSMPMPAATDAMVDYYV
jgi:flagellar hook-length control protein FliK